MIYCVWYPSGGFGHFVNAILTLHGNNFVRPSNSLEFSANGHSHNLDLVVPKYLYNCWPGGVEFQHNKNYCVLVDNGINNESTQFKSTFPDSTVIKICYSDYSWPVVARTMIDKAMHSSIELQLPTDHWNTNEPWALREKYFLYLRDHAFRHAWRSSNNQTVNDVTLSVEALYHSYLECFTTVNAIVETDDFCNMWKEWRLSNDKYIAPVITANEVLSWVMSGQSKDLTHITDIWTQAIVYYYIWLQYHIEVPHNDFADFFSNTDQITKLVT